MANINEKKAIYTGSNGYEVPSIYKESGQTLLRMTQTVTFGTDQYAPAFGTVFPFGPSGVFNPTLWRNISGLDKEALLRNLQVDSIQGLRLMKSLGKDQQVSVSGYYTPGDGGGGLYVTRIPSTQVDNGGDIIVTAEGIVLELMDKSRISINLFGARSGSTYDCSPSVRAAINAHPYSKISYIPTNSGYYFNSEILDPPSASYTLIGSDSLQSSMQTPFVVNFNGALFHTGSTNTVFTSFKNILFKSNRVSFPSARAIFNEGNYIHGTMENISVQNFAKPAIEVLQAANACEFNKILVMFCDDYGIKLHAGSTNSLSHINGDNTLGGIAYVVGGSNVLSTLYSEDCCKRNVTEGKDFREFVISGDANVINGYVINSFAGNSTPPLALGASRNTTLVGVVNKSSTTPSYTYEVELGGTDSSATLINCTGLRTGNQNKNVIVIDSGYTIANPSIKMGKFDLEKGSPLARLAWNGVTAAIKQGYNIVRITRVATGVFDIEFTGTGYLDGMLVFGSSDNAGNTLPVSCNEVLGLRTTTNVRMETRRADGLLVDTQFCSVIMYGEPPL